MTTDEQGSCSTHRLSELTLGQLDNDARQELEQHVAGCPRCREALGWLAGVDQLLGGQPRPDDQHPGSAELLDHAAGALPAARQAEVAEHLATCLSCRRLVGAARAGLDELALLDTEETHEVLALPAPPLRAAAADAGAPSPAPEDRRVLDEVPGVCRLIYFRRRARSLLGLFYEPGAAVTLDRCTLDGEALEQEQTPEGTLVALGSAAALPGKTVGLRLTVDGQVRELSWTVVQEATR